MCGIAGIYCLNGDVRQFPLEEMKNSMQHRGPDSSGVWIDETSSISLIHTRLSILDLSSSGHQPMIMPEIPLSITFNGEIYNHNQLRDDLRKKGHKFISSSDTEVVLAAYAQWGDECVDRLIGMFAFCIYDEKRKTIFVARDPVGEKPLYYFYNDNIFCFASELNCLLNIACINKKISYDDLDNYLAYGYSRSDYSMIEGVKKLKPGHVLSVSEKSIKPVLRKYWKPPTYNGNSRINKEELLDILHDKLVKSVTRQLSADVPVGVLLSGGLDSSMVAAIAASSSNKPIKTFNISFAGHGEHDEAQFARLVSDYYSTDHTEIVAEKISSEFVYEVGQKMDEPIADHAIIPSYLLSKEIKEHVTVALGGDGGDELFAGYPHYQLMDKQLRIRKYLPSGIRCFLSSCSRRLPLGKAGRNHLIGVHDSIDNAVSHVNMYFDESNRIALTSAFSPNQKPESYKNQISSLHNTVLQKVAHTDFHTTLPSAFLVKLDRVSMMNSLELRSPFLDKELVEFVFESVPDIYKQHGNRSKILLKELGKSVLPETLELNRKQGLTMPVRTWFQSDWGDYAKSVLLDNGSIWRGQFIERLFELQKRGYDNSSRLLALTFFEIWRKGIGATP